MFKHGLQQKFFQHYTHFKRITTLGCYCYKFNVFTMVTWLSSMVHSVYPRLVNPTMTSCCCDFVFDRIYSVTASSQPCYVYETQVIEKLCLLSVSKTRICRHQAHKTTHQNNVSPTNRPSRKDSSRTTRWGTFLCIAELRSPLILLLLEPSRCKIESYRPGQWANSVVSPATWIGTSQGTYPVLCQTRPEFTIITVLNIA